MARMIVKNKSLYYARRSMKAGEVFEAPEVDANYFRKRGQADDAPAEPKAAPVRPPVRPVETARPVVPKAADAAPKPAAVDEKTTVAPMTTETAASLTPDAGVYGRRDLRATD